MKLQWNFQTIDNIGWRANERSRYYNTTRKFIWKKVFKMYNRSTDKNYLWSGKPSNEAKVERYTQNGKCGITLDLSDAELKLVKSSRIAKWFLNKPLESKLFVDKGYRHVTKKMCSWLIYLCWRWGYVIWVVLNVCQPKMTMVLLWSSSSCWLLHGLDVNGCCWSSLSSNFIT